jgi:hypothetical protein
MITFSLNKEAAVKPEPADEKPGREMRRGNPGAGMPAMAFNRAGRDGEKVQVEIFDAANDTVRSYEITVEDEGVNRIYWNMRMDGQSGPTRRNFGGGGFFGFQPGGNPVLPGTYKVKLSYGGSADSTMLKVDFDPRMDIRNADVERTYAMADELAELNKKAVELADLLKDAEAIMNANDAMIKADSRPKDEMENINTISKDTRGILDSLFIEMFGPEDDGRQGIVRNPNNSVSNALRAPARYLGSAYWGPGSNETDLFRLAEIALEEFTAKVNNFISVEWPGYKKAVEEANLSAFKELKPVQE